MPASKKTLNEVNHGKKLVQNMLLTAVILTVILVGFSIIGYRSVAMYTILMLIPGICSILIDWRKGRHASKTIFIFNLAGLMPQLVHVLGSGSPDNIAINLIKAMPAPAIIPWMAAMFGWSVIFMFPKVVQLFLEVKAAYMINKLETEQDKLVNEWGDNLKKFVPKDVAEKMKKKG